MALQGDYPVTVLCETLDCARSSFYYQAQQDDDTVLRTAIEQLAGDLLPETSSDQILATEHGIIPPWTVLATREQCCQLDLVRHEHNACSVNPK